MVRPGTRSAQLAVFVGLATLDVIHRVARRAGPDEKVTALRQDIAAGGPAANAAVTYATLGGRARLVTALGKDRLAGVIGDELRAQGVEVVDVDPDADAPPAVSAILIDDDTGARSVTSLDATGRSVPSAASTRWDELLTDARVVLLDGHHRMLAVGAARAAAGAGIPVVLDAGRWKPVMAELIPLAADVLCSAEFRWPGTTDAVASARRILTEVAEDRIGHDHAARRDGARFVAVTNGAGPVTWWSGRESGQVDVPQVRAVDTLGAGDAFHGAYAFLRNDPALSPAERLAGAARVAARRVTTVGPRDWLAGIRPAPS